MSFPVFSQDDEVAFNFQVKAKTKRHSKISAGFSMFDDMFFQMACVFVQVKLHELIERQERNVHKQEVVDTIKLVSIVSTQRTYADLILQMKKLIPAYLGF
jgi:hypothetical protein